MEEFAKVEKLVEMTGASYEDARNALRACDGDMVDSMVYLEKLGKVTKYNTNTIPLYNTHTLNNAYQRNTIS